MRASSPVRTPKLQLAAEQVSTGEGWLPPKNDISRPRVKEEPQQDGRRGKLHLESNPIPARDAQRAQTKTCALQDPETPQRLSQTYL